MTLRRFLLWTLFWLAIGLFFSTRALLSTLLHHSTAPWSVIVFPWTIHWLLWGAITPLVVRLARAFPLPPIAPRSVLAHLVAAPVLTTAQFAATGVLLWLLSQLLPSLSMLVSNLPVEFANQFHFGLLAYFLTVGYVVARSERHRAREQELLLSQLDRQLARSELAALRMQIHPHFLFNSLHATTELVHEDPERAERLLLGLADLLRRTLRASECAAQSLTDELDFVETYLSLEQARLEERLHYRIEASDEALMAEIPTLLLQPLVENAVRHGVARRRRPGSIEVRATRRDDSLEVEIENDLADAGGAPPTGSGIGLVNVRSRLESLYGASAQLDLESDHERYRARVRIPWRRHAQAREAG